MATGTTVAPEFSASQATPLLIAEASPLPRVPSGRMPDAPAGVENLPWPAAGPPGRRARSTGSWPGGGQDAAQEAAEHLLLDQDVHGPRGGAEHDRAVQEADVVPGEDHGARRRDVATVPSPRSGRRRGPGASPRAGSTRSSTVPAVPVPAQSTAGDPVMVDHRSTMPRAASTVCSKSRSEESRVTTPSAAVREVHHRGVLGVALGHLGRQLLGVLAAAELDSPAAQPRLFAWRSAASVLPHAARRRW